MKFKTKDFELKEGQKAYHFYGDKFVTKPNGEDVMRHVVISGIEENNTIVIGVAMCSEKEDKYIKRKGRMISMGRAIKANDNPEIIAEKPMMHYIRLEKGQPGKEFKQWCQEFCEISPSEDVEFDEL